MGFKVVLTCVLYQICVNVRLVGMRVQNKRLYLFLACIFDENSHTCSARTRITQSGLTLSRQIRLNKAAVHFLGMYTRLELNSRTLPRRLGAAISAWQTPEEMPETLL